MFAFATTKQEFNNVLIKLNKHTSNFARFIFLVVLAELFKVHWFYQIRNFFWWVHVLINMHYYIISRVGRRLCHWCSTCKGLLLNCFQGTLLLIYLVWHRTSKLILLFSKYYLLFRYIQTILCHWKGWVWVYHIQVFQISSLFVITHLPFGITILSSGGSISLILMQVMI